MAAKYRNISVAVDKFAEAMKRKLLLKAREGWTGWNHAAFGRRCREKLRDHIPDGDPIDVANFAMFLWNLGEPTHRKGE